VSSVLGMSKVNTKEMEEHLQSLDSWKGTISSYAKLHGITPRELYIARARERYQDKKAFRERGFAPVTTPAGLGLRDESKERSKRISVQVEAFGFRFELKRN